MTKRQCLGIAAVVLFITGTTNAADYLSTEIVKGYSWQYQVTYSGLSGEATKITRIVELTIDSIWRAPGDTLFFRVAERDSVTRVLNVSSPPIIDTIYSEDRILLCRKANRITICDSSPMVSSLFTDVAIAEFDSVEDVHTVFSHPTTMVVHTQLCNGLQFGYYNPGIASHFGTYTDTTVFIDKMGLFSKRSIHTIATHIGEYDSSITLLRYSYPTNTAAALNRKSAIAASASVMFRSTVCRNSQRAGFNLLGQGREAGVGGFGVRIMRESPYKQSNKR